jgi:hypothetical protein
MAARTGKTTVKKVAKSKPTLVKGKATVKAEKPAPKAKTAKAPKADTPSKFIGVSTGMRVQAFQDKLMKDNYRAKLSDAALAQAMRDEFPNAVAFTEKHVAGIRSQYNHGHRASQEGVPPANTLAKFDDEGNKINPRARAEKAEAAPVKKTAKKAAKKAAPVEVDEDDEDDEDDDTDDETDE